MSTTEEKLHSTGSTPYAAPPLTIRHFLYWTAGVAIALWFKFGVTPPRPKNLAGVLLVSSTVMYCIAAGGSIAFLFWLLGRRLSFRTVPLVSSGARYATVLGISMLFSLLSSLGENQLAQFADSNPDAWLVWWSTLHLINNVFDIAILIFGLFWIGGVAWRIVLASAVFLRLFSLYDSLVLFELVSRSATSLSDTTDWLREMLHYVPLCAVIASVIADQRRNTRRDWRHYFGVVLVMLMTLEYSLVPLAISILKFNRT